MKEAGIAQGGFYGHLNSRDAWLAAAGARGAPHRAATVHIKEMRDRLARQFPDGGQPQAHEWAKTMVCALIGAATVGRAVVEPRLTET